jgi:hypothetical protein
MQLPATEDSLSSSLIDKANIRTIGSFMILQLVFQVLLGQLMEVMCRLSVQVEIMQSFLGIGRRGIPSMFKV